MPFRTGLLWMLLGACLALFGLTAPAHAEPGMVGSPLRVCIARALPGDDPSALIRHPERFDCTSEQRSFGSGNYWAISQPLALRLGLDRPMVARAASLWQDGLDFHVLYADGRVASEHADGRGVSRHIQLGAIVEFAIPSRKAAVQRVMWRIDNAANLRGILLGARIASQAQAAQSNLVMGAIYSAFGGLCIALIVYNFALWGALRHRFQLAYCAMVLGLLVYACSSSGALAWVADGITNNMRLRINHLSLAFSGAAALAFARSFFEARVFEGWLGKLVNALAVLLLGVGIFAFLCLPIWVHAVDKVYALAFLIVPSAMLPLLWRAWRRRSNYLWLFALAWAAPFALTIARAINNLGNLGWSFWLDNSTIIGMTIEALISSLAIAYRMRVLSRERDDARAGEAVARRLAETDPLTGLLNRRAFLERAIGRSGEQMLIIIDIDHFKRVNDTLGHDGGDEVLRVFARTLRAATHAGALVARIGGEEFALIADAAAPVEPEAILARLRATRMPFDLAVTASIGSARGPLLSDVDWKKLYREADAALFAAKSAGRDRARAA